MVEYRTGNLLESGCDLICHQVNCQGVMGAGIAKAIRDKHPEVYEAFLYTSRIDKAKLGEIDFIPLDDKDKELHCIRFCVNLYSQEHYLPRGINHTDYNAFRACLKKVKELVSGLYEDIYSVRIGFPDHIGCGLAGGNWNIVKEIIESEFSGKEWRVEIWKLK